MCNRLTKLSVTMWYTFFGIFDDTSLWILSKTHDPSLCDTPDDIYIWPNKAEIKYEVAVESVAMKHETKFVAKYTRVALCYHAILQRR